MWLYHVTGADELTKLGECRCSGATCFGVTSCVVASGALEPYTTYRFHLRAVDDKGNLTTHSPASAHALAFRTTDQTSPEFSPFPVFGAAPEYALSFSAANDRQGEGVITYDIFRSANKPFPFANSDDPVPFKTLEDLVADPAVSWVGSTQVTSFNDPGPFGEGSTYYYTFCARDASNNKFCPGASSIIARVAGDSSPPTDVVLTKEQAEGAKTWNLSFPVHDEGVHYSQLVVNVYRTVTDKKEQPTREVKNLYRANAKAGEDLGCNPLCTLQAESGPSDKKVWVNYVVTVADLEGNTTVSNYLHVESDNYFAVDRIWPTKGTMAGGTVLLVQGAGFGVNAKVKIGDVDCPVERVVSDNYILCRTAQTTTTGAKLVKVTNGNGFESPSSAFFEYQKLR